MMINTIECFQGGHEGHFIFMQISSPTLAREKTSTQLQLISFHTNLALFSLLFFSLMRSNCQCPLYKSA